MKVSIKISFIVIFLLFLSTFTVEAQKYHAEDSPFGITAREFRRQILRDDWLKILEHLHDIGAKKLRFFINWSEVEPENDQWNDWWINFVSDRLKSLKNYGIEPYIVISNGFPDWAMSDEHIECGKTEELWGTATCHYPPKDINEWNEYVAKMVDAWGYGVNGKKLIRHWEILWEENAGWDTVAGYFYDHPEEYVNLLENSYETIKAIDPSAKIVFGRIVHQPPYSRTFFGRVLNLGGGDYFDIFNLGGTYRCGLVDEFGRRINVYKSILTAYGYNKEFWTTEVHCASDIDIDGVTDPEGELIQAENLQGLFNVAIEEEITMFWQSYKDRVDMPVLGKRASGIVRDDYSEKPSYYAYKEIAKWYTGPETPQIISPTNGEIITIPYKFDWDDVQPGSEDFDGYMIQIDDNSSFLSPEIETEEPNSEYWLNENLADGNYYFRVKAKDVYDNFGDWSDTVSFGVSSSGTTTTQPSTTTITSTTTTSTTTIPITTSTSTSTTTTIPCALTNAYWSQSSAIEGETVQLTVEGTNCDGQIVSLNYWEEDESEMPTGSFIKSLTGNFLDFFKSLFGFGVENDPINPDDYNLPRTMSFDDNMASTTWQAVWFEDTDGKDNDPEIFFEASLDSQSITSNILKIKQKIPTYPVTINDAQILDPNHNLVNSIQYGQQYYVKATIENVGTETKNPMLVIQIKNSKDEVVGYISSLKSNVAGGNINYLEVGYLADKSDTYTAEVFVWSDWPVLGGEPLASPSSKTFTVME